MDPQQQPRQGDLSWRLSSHPVTLLCFLAFRICAFNPVPCVHSAECAELLANHKRYAASLLLYLLGGLFGSNNFVLIFILTILLLAIDFYYLKNIAGRRLVGLRWWNEVDISTGDSTWVFESSPGRGSEHGGNKTDSRFFWLGLYVQPALWIGLAVLAMLRFDVVWLSVIVIALILTITNTVAFSRCDKFSQASNLASSAMYSSGLARNIAGGMFNRLFSRS
ncbi:Golgi apparatus membrane protein tvp23 [Trapelia coarctata]|nr:Golgi apparatus membrane protein tvp23 [Trapelia coarctata]